MAWKFSKMEKETAHGLTVAAATAVYCNPIIQFSHTVWPWLQPRPCTASGVLYCPTRFDRVGSHGRGLLDPERIFSTIFLFY